MKFFIPDAITDEQAESIYQTIATNIDAHYLDQKRIYQIRWEHEGEPQEAIIGQCLPECFGIKSETVLAIFDCGETFKICTPQRGAIQNEPVVTSRMFVDHLEYFDTETQ